MNLNSKSFKPQLVILLLLFTVVPLLSFGPVEKPVKHMRINLGVPGLEGLASTAQLN